MIIMTEMAQKTGKEKNGKNQINPARKAPKIGLNTFPNVLDVSIRPKQQLTSSSLLNISPTKGMTIGAAPAAPTPWRARPAKIIQYASSSFHAANPEMSPP